MDKNFFESICSLFNKYGFRLYLVGGSTRDFLLNRNFDDYDFATDATPTDMRIFLPNEDYSFEKFGCVKLKNTKYNVEITTMRIEGEYKDYRHPSYIKFVSSIKEDYVRRDFTINSIYLDEKFNIFDYCGGVDDIKKKIIRFIGSPDVRIKEDPLRILRAERFAKKLGFKIDENTKKSIDKNRKLLDELNPQKIREEMKK